MALTLIALLLIAVCAFFLADDDADILPCDHKEMLGLTDGTYVCATCKTPL